MMNPRARLACRWTARRVQRYLDDDPAARLDQVEARRLQAVLDVCARCSGRMQEYQALSRALRHRSAWQQPDPALVARVRRQAELVTSHGLQ